MPRYLFRGLDAEKAFKRASIQTGVLLPVFYHSSERTARKQLASVRAVVCVSVCVVSGSDGHPVVCLRRPHPAEGAPGLTAGVGVKQVQALRITVDQPTSG